MKRPFLVWLAFAACTLVGCGVLGWFTREMLRLDHESTEARRLAAVEENIRLALWRMDSALANVHGLEAARPVQDFVPFFRAGAAYSANGLAPMAPGTVLLPSPLLGYAPPFVKLHFQRESTAVLNSPQAPPVTLRPAALTAGIPAERFAPADADLAELRSHLADTDLATLLPPVPAAPFSAHALAAGEKEESDYASSLFQKKNRDAKADDVAQEVAASATADSPEPAIVAPARARDEQSVQRSKNEAEQRERALTRELNLTYNQEIAENRLQQAPITLDETSDFPGGAGRARRQDARARPEAAPPSAMAEGAVAAKDAGATGASEAAGDALADADKAGASTSAPAPLAKSTVALPPDVAGPLQAIWVGDELLLARRAVVDGADVVQGAWLDWPELRAWLLSRISDLLPAARLEPVPADGTVTSVDAARRLAFLPVQLAPGPVRIDGSAIASPLRISVTIAWVGAAIGLVALALLLRGTIRLSERRGAFVSAVTHELRTPLTTFRMYTEMLASGMVKDEAKRQGYVETLHQESTRLSHLVENVLSYARLERGRAAARVEDTTPGELLARMEERLRQRAQQGGLTVQVEFADGVADAGLRTDTTAVEQVLFNLVDNATKYGRPKDGGGVITINVSLTKPDRLAIRVADPGPGLTIAARKRLFQPFSKSATEAAHSQPGVGLGLALCRRLARDELHGELTLERTGPNGTVFRLELPLIEQR